MIGTTMPRFRDYSPREACEALGKAGMVDRASPYAAHIHL
jgi:hypothetical protein